ncbi:AfsR/SARP family transcriptional regulator [Streptomyces zagrosensis]|uniref:DNA-binding SARP family transcriptional activator/tetratricopeptide (TPR) repeat protein n=1 Tax=Streptomyces zagrosensis TaxID=1042984 RepID=A0A7W9V234_9ACTN|nr:AfsR/SARP family transcriptional regulator [Streptomyces zagrosensis]MBB5938896.1 DNA-binding SARP family transcriptional activator/tetratricopeptide (TPR) repeat protein [Streptomyces zagrosensis]
MEVTGEPPEERVLTPRAAKLRIVLASLLVRAHRVVSVDALTDELWGDAPPRTPTATLQVYVSHLRKTLRAADPRHGRDALVTQSPGYLLRPQPGQLDLTEFEELHDRGHRALEHGDYAAASDLHRRALALWRGPMLADTPHGALLGGAATWGWQVRTSALEQRIRADLQLGRHHELIGELRALVSEHPLREELHAHLMLALFRAERQAEALQVFASLRGTLIDELGTEPGPPLQRLHRRILGDDPELLVSGRAAAPPSSALLPRRLAVGLPAADPSFTGRTAALAEVERWLRRAPAGSCVAIAGPAGVGKTALAVEAAHRAAEVFPDGRIYLDLHPSGRGPLSPTEAMERLLRRADVPGPLPADPVELCDLVQRLLAGRRMLLILDSAASEAQVRPLLPTGAGSTALITSRRLPAGLSGVRPVLLRVPDPDEARAMFEVAAALTRPVQEPAAVARIVELCGALPLAVRIAAAKLSARPHWTAAVLADRLADEGGRLSQLAVGDLAVRDALLAAYRAASPAERRAFRLLGLLPPGAFGLWLATAVLGVTPGEAQQLIEALVDARLLEAAGAADTRPGRYRLHELLRLLAVELVADESPAAVRAATERMGDACADAAAYADALLAPGRRGGDGAYARAQGYDGGASDHGGGGAHGSDSRRNATGHARRPAENDHGLSLLLGRGRGVGSGIGAAPAPAGPGPIGYPPPGPAEAGPAWHASAVGHHPLDWFAAEQATLVAVAVAAHAARLWRPTIRLVDSMSCGLETCAAWDDWLTTHTLALDAAHHCGDRRAEARLLRSLGDLAWQRRDLQEARECYQRARLAAWEVTDAKEYGRTLVGLAELSLGSGRLDEAVRLLNSALSVVSTPVDIRGRYDALRALSLVALESGDVDAAVRSFGECLELAGALRDRRLEAYARRALRTLRAVPPSGCGGEQEAHWAQPSGVEVRPGVWRLRTPALS